VACAAVLLTTVMTATAGPAIRTASSPDCPGNLLTNPGFENGFSIRNRLVEMVANGWHSWYETVPGVDGLNYPPAYAPRFRLRDNLITVLEGLWSQELSTEGTTHTGGLWQRVTVPPGSQVLARAWGYAWASNGDDPGRSQPPGTYALLIGLDPRGGEDPRSQTIIWTTPITTTDQWLPMTLDVPVDGPQVTLFLRGQALERLKHNTSRWDATCLRVLGPAGEPTPTTTAAPWPTRTPGPGTPTVTSDLPTPYLAATRVALEVSLGATMVARAATAGSAPSGGGPASALATAAAGGGRSRASGSGETGLTEPATDASLWETVFDQLGLVALALAVFVIGLAAAVGRK
jgi:hypothetical protein